VSEFIDFTVPTGLFNLGSFTPVQTPVAPALSTSSGVASRIAEIEAEVERKRQEEEARRVAPKPADISAYYDALRAGEDRDEFADILQSTLADQGYLTSGFEMAEAGAYAPVTDDLFIVPGGIDPETGLGEFTFDKTLKDFKGADFDYGTISNEKLKEFQEELLPVMAPAIAREELAGKSYQNALIGAYENNSEVQEIYAKYDIAPQRIGRKYGSEYVYDPFTFSEIKTVDRSKDFMDYVGDVVQAGLPLLATAGLGGALSGTSLFGGGQSALGTAASKSLTSAAVAGATGGDPLKAALTSGIDSGLGILEAQAPALYNDIEFAYNVARGEPGLAFLNRGLNVVEDGGITGTTTVGEKFTTDALNNVGLTSNALANYNINQKDLVSGLVKVEEKLIQGEDLEDSLRSGLIEYAREGGGVPDFGINLGIALETPEFLSGIARAVRDFGSAFDDAILQPPKEAIETLYEAIPTPDVSLPEVDIPIPEVDIDLPEVDISIPEVDIDLPKVDVDLPSVDVDLPSVDLDIPAPSIGLSISQPQPTKGVTESLFEDFLFEKKYEAPELIERRIPLQGYQAPLDIFRRTI